MGKQEYHYNEIAEKSTKSYLYRLIVVKDSVILPKSAYNSPKVLKK